MWIIWLFSFGIVLGLMNIYERQGYIIYLQWATKEMFGSLTTKFPMTTFESLSLISPLRPLKTPQVCIFLFRGAVRWKFSEIHKLLDIIRAHYWVDLIKNVRRRDLVRESPYNRDISDCTWCLIQNYEKNVGIFDMIIMDKSKSPEAEWVKKVLVSFTFIDNEI